MPVIIHDFESKLLRNNPLGDPAQRRIPVYVPAEYERSAKAYPVVYLLAGFSGRGLTFLNDAPWEETMPERLDRLIGSGEVRPLIAVMPDCRTKLGGSQYLNSSATGRYEDHLVRELVPFIDVTYRTIANRDQRAIAGKSSGGYGATVLAMRYPEVFGMAADHSGDKYFELCYKADIPRCLAGLAPHRNSVDEFLREFPHPVTQRGAYWFDTVNMLAMASCYSPSSEASAGFELPFDTYTGELRADVWRRWLAHDPVELVAAHADALRSLRLYYLDCGRRDEHHLQYGARIYVQRMRSLGIPHHYEEFEAGHRNVAYRYDVSLRMISEAF